MPPGERGVGGGREVGKANNGLCILARLLAWPLWLSYNFEPYLRTLCTVLYCTPPPSPHKKHPDDKTPRQTLPFGVGTVLYLQMYILLLHHHHNIATQPILPHVWHGMCASSPPPKLAFFPPPPHLLHTHQTGHAPNMYTKNTQKTEDPIMYVQKTVPYVFHPPSPSLSLPS